VLKRLKLQDPEEQIGVEIVRPAIEEHSMTKSALYSLSRGIK